MVSLPGRLRWQDGFIIRKVKMTGWFCYQEGLDDRMVSLQGRFR